MKISIYAQHLRGNDPEGLDAAAWVHALETEYRLTALHHFPDAEVSVRIDCQNASGYTSGPSVDYDEDEGVPTTAQADLTFAIEQAQNALWDARGDEFFGEP